MGEESGRAPLSYVLLCFGFCSFPVVSRVLLHCYYCTGGDLLLFITGDRPIIGLRMTDVGSSEVSRSK